MKRGLPYPTECCSDVCLYPNGPSKQQLNLAKLISNQDKMIQNNSQSLPIDTISLLPDISGDRLWCVIGNPDNSLCQTALKNHLRHCSDMPLL